MKKKIYSFFTAANTTVVAGVVLALAGVTSPAAAQSPNPPVMLGPVQLFRDAPSYVDFAVGVFNIQENRDTSASPEARIEFRYGRKLWIFGPAVGVLANSQGGALVYGGFYSDLKYDRIVITPLAAVGGYHRGGSEDLGGAFEFRLSLAVSYEFSDSSRLGLQVAHISNANINEKNPSDNELLLTYAIPIRR